MFCRYILQKDTLVIFLCMFEDRRDFRREISELQGWDGELLNKYNLFCQDSTLYKYHLLNTSFMLITVLFAPLYLI